MLQRQGQAQHALVLDPLLMDRFNVVIEKVVPDHGFDPGTGTLDFEHMTLSLDEDRHLRLVYYAACESHLGAGAFEDWLRTPPPSRKGSNVSRIGDSWCKDDEQLKNTVHKVRYMVFN